MDREGNGPFQLPVAVDEADIEPPNDQRMRPRIRSRKYRFLLAGDGVKALESLSDTGMSLAEPASWSAVPGGRRISLGL